MALISYSLGCVEKFGLGLWKMEDVVIESDEVPQAPGQEGDQRLCISLRSHAMKVRSRPCAVQSKAVTMDEETSYMPLIEYIIDIYIGNIVVESNK